MTVKFSDIDPADPIMFFTLREAVDWLQARGYAVINTRNTSLDDLPKVIGSQISESDMARLELVLNLRAYELKNYMNSTE
jgi:hypothetical protein